MSLIPFLLIAFIGATASLVVRGPERLATAIGLDRPGGRGRSRPSPSGRRAASSSAGNGLATTAYLRLYLALGALVGLSSR